MAQDARDASAETITAGDEHRAFYLLPVWKRIVVMFGGPFMNLLIAVVLFGVLLAIFWTGFLRVGSQISLFLAPVATVLLIAGWLAQPLA